MIGVKNLIQMIEFRRKTHALVSGVADQEPHPSNVPVNMLWSEPEYLIYVVERELSALRWAGATEGRCMEIIGKFFKSGGRPADDSELHHALLERYFPGFASENLTALPKLRAMAAASFEETWDGDYPPQEWLCEEMSLEDFRDHMSESIAKLTIFPTSTFDAELLHVLVMLELGGRLVSYSSPPETWRYMMGRGGIALVRNGSTIAHVETVMN